MGQALPGPRSRGGGALPAAAGGVGELRGCDAARRRVHGAGDLRPEEGHAGILLPLSEPGTAFKTT